MPCFIMNCVGCLCYALWLCTSIAGGVLEGGRHASSFADLAVARYQGVMIHLCLKSNIPSFYVFIWILCWRLYACFFLLFGIKQIIHFMRMCT